MAAIGDKGSSYPTTYLHLAQRLDRQGFRTAYTRTKWRLAGGAAP